MTLRILVSKCSSQPECGKPGHATEENEEDRGEACGGDRAEDHCGENRAQDQNGEKALLHAAEHLQPGGQDEVYDTHLNSAKCTCNEGK